MCERVVVPNFIYVLHGFVVRKIEEFRAPKVVSITLDDPNNGACTSSASQALFRVERSLTDVDNGQHGAVGLIVLKA